MIHYYLDHGLAVDDATGLAFDNDGDIWVQTEDGGYAVTDDNIANHPDLHAYLEGEAAAGNFTTVGEAEPAMPEGYSGPPPEWQRNLEGMNYAEQLDNSAAEEVWREGVIQAAAQQAVADEAAQQRAAEDAQTQAEFAAIAGYLEHEAQKLVPEHERGTNKAAAIAQTALDHSVATGTSPDELLPDAAKAVTKRDRFMNWALGRSGLNHDEIDELASKQRVNSEDVQRDFKRWDAGMRDRPRDTLDEGLADLMVGLKEARENTDQSPPSQGDTSLNDSPGHTRSADTTPTSLDAAIENMAAQLAGENS
jgi:hypothetical protein